VLTDPCYCGYNTRAVLASWDWHTMDLKLLGILAALGSAASWALGSILFKRLGESISSPAMTLAKELLSVVLLGVALVLTGFETVGANALWLLVLSGLLGIAAGDTFFFAALQDLGPVATVVLLTLGQVLTVVLAVVFLGESPTAWAWLGIVLVIAGVAAVLVAKMSGEQQASKRRGILLGLASVVCTAVSMIVAKRGLDEVSALQATFIRMLAGAAGLLVVGVATLRLRQWAMPFRDTRLAAEFVGAVAVVTFGGFWLSLAAIKYVDVSIANTLTSIDAVFVLPLAAVFLKEKTTWAAIAGTATTVTGVVLLCLQSGGR
jgi:drug/metabolite transporter (DMT)-like permease